MRKNFQLYIYVSKCGYSKVDTVIKYQYLIVG